MKNSCKLSLIAAAALGLGAANAAVSVFWDFSPGNEYGWTTVNGVSWLDANGVEAGQADGDGVAGYFGGVNTTGATRRAHDGAHETFLYQSPVINFADAALPTSGTILEVLWTAGNGNQSGNADPADPAAVLAYNGGTSDANGSKGVALLNMTTGQYDAFSYHSAQGNATQTQSFTLADLTTAGVSTTDNYRLDFFEHDDGSWGWTRLQQVNLHEDVVGAIPEPSSFALFGLGGLALLLRRRR